jgi:hypothetical protein
MLDFTLQLFSTQGTMLWYFWKVPGVDVNAVWKKKIPVGTEPR